MSLSNRRVVITGIGVLTSIGMDAGSFWDALARGQEATHTLAAGRGAWIQIARGSLSVGGTKLTAGDGASTEEAGKLSLSAEQDTEALLFDLG